MNNITMSIVTIITAIVGVALIAVIVSRNSNTAQVLAAGGSSVANMISSAVSPVTGRAATPNVSIGAVNTGGLNMPFGFTGSIQL